MHTTEITQRAKQYLDSLAQGIDPISGEALPQDSVLNQERLSRCFLYVSGVLQTVLAQDGTAPVSSWDPLLASGALDRFEYSEQPLALHQFVVRLNSLRGPSPAKDFPQTALTNWLLHEGFLTAAAGGGEEARSDGANYSVSKRGEAIGISMRVVQAETTSRTYSAIFCNETAQRFLVCSLDRIIAYHQASWERRLALLDPDKIPYSAQPVPISDFLKRLNGAAGWTSPNWLMRHVLHSWLFQEGYLEKRIGKTGKTRIFNTRKGEENGISRYVDSYKGLNNTRVVYTEAGQRFIVSHLRDIVLL